MSIHNLSCTVPFIVINVFNENEILLSFFQQNISFFWPSKFCGITWMVCVEQRVCYLSFILLEFSEHNLVVQLLIVFGFEICMTCIWPQFVSMEFFWDSCCLKNERNRHAVNFLGYDRLDIIRSLRWITEIIDCFGITLN